MYEHKWRKIERKSNATHVIVKYQFNTNRRNGIQNWLSFGIYFHSPSILADWCWFEFAFHFFIELDISKQVRAHIESSRTVEILIFVNVFVFVATFFSVIYFSITKFN